MVNKVLALLCAFAAGACSTRLVDLLQVVGPWDANVGYLAFMVAGLTFGAALFQFPFVRPG